MEGLKICKTCGIEKPFGEYQKAGKGKWLQPYCKPCDSERKKQHRLLNIDKIKSSNKAKYADNKVEILSKQKIYYKTNADLISKRAKAYREKNKSAKSLQDKAYREKNRDTLNARIKAKRSENPEYYKKRAKKYRLARTSEQKEKKKAWDNKFRETYKERRRELDALNKEAIRARNRKYNNIKSATDIEFRILKNLRSRTRFALKKWDTVKSDTTEKLLGCSVSNFKIYFTSLFTDGMSWELFMSGEIHIDHKKPCCEFDLTNEQEQRECFHYTNLQPLWWVDNLKKGVKWEA